jgi:hypothetical protein
MKRWFFSTRCVAFLMAALLLEMLAGQAFAQDQAPPPRQAPVMQNVFYNVVWGSAVGTLLGLASAIESSSDKTQPVGARSNAFEGATIGGLLGLAAGIYLVFSGISFDPQGSTITDAAPMSEPTVAYAPKDLAPAPDSAPVTMFASAVPVQPAFTLETASGQPNKIIGFRVLVTDLRF